MNWKFSTSRELLERCAEAGLALADYLVAREAFHSGKTPEAIREELNRRIRVERAALDRGITEAQVSFSGMTKGAAVKLAKGDPVVEDEFFQKALAYALAINEVNACGGRIIAFPTAGSCGIVPGVLWAWKDARAPGLDPESKLFQDAFVVASGIGILIAMRATLAGASGGCQAECGAAGAMAAAGLASLLGSDAPACLDAAALSLKNSLGLACDPVAGLVEVPCVKRNAFLAANALTAVSLSRAGISSVIPFDEVVGAMKAIGDAMPQAIRESAEGGLARTPTGISYQERIK